MNGYNKETVTAFFIMHNDLTHYHLQTLVDGGHGPADVSPLDGDQEVLGPGLVTQVLDHYTTWNHFKLIEKEILRAAIKKYIASY